MREYGQMQCSFWTDADIQSLSDEAVILASYLLTGPHSNGLGCYRLPDGYILEDRPNWTRETVSKGFEELSRIGFCKRCETTKYVLIPKFLRWNPISNGNVAKARIKEFDTIPKKSSIYKDLCCSCLEYGAFWPNHFKTVCETVSKGYGKQDPTLPNPTKTLPEQSSSAPPTSNGTHAGTAAGLMAKALREAGVDVTPHNPVLLAWVADGVSYDQLLSCVDIVKNRDPDRKRIAAKYLDAVVRDQLNQIPGKGGTTNVEISDPGHCSRAKRVNDKLREIAQRGIPADGPRESPGGDGLCEVVAALPAQVDISD